MISQTVRDWARELDIPVRKSLSDSMALECSDSFDHWTCRELTGRELLSDEVVDRRNQENCGIAIAAPWSRAANALEPDNIAAEMRRDSHDARNGKNGKKRRS